MVKKDEKNNYKNMTKSNVQTIDENNFWKKNHYKNMTKSNVPIIADKLNKELKNDKDIDTKIPELPKDFNHTALAKTIKIIAGCTSTSREAKAVKFLGVMGIMLYKVLVESTSAELGNLRRAIYTAIKGKGSIEDISDPIIKNLKYLDISADTKNEVTLRLEEIKHTNRKRDASDKDNAFIEKITQERKAKGAKMKEDDSKDMEMLQKEFEIQTEYEGKKKKRRIARQNEAEQKQRLAREQVIARKAIMGIDTETLKEIQEKIYDEE